MNILFLSHTSFFDGSGRALLNLVESLSKIRDCSINVVLPPVKGDLKAHLRDIGVNCFELYLPWSIYPASETLKDKILYLPYIILYLIKSLWAYFRLLKLVLKLKPDIIHSNVGVLRTGYYVSKRLGIKHVWHIREFQDKDFGWKIFPSKYYFKKLLLSDNNTCIFVSKCIQKNFLSEFSGIVIYDGVLKKTEIKPIIENKDKYFLFVGNLTEGKGVLHAVDAFIEFSKEISGYYLVIAGVGASYNRIQQISEQNPNIKLLGFRNDIYRLMSNATALIAPSRCEGFGFIIAEAMYNGCTTIGRNTAGIKEQFDNALVFSGEELGLRFNNDQELKNAMLNIVKTDPAILMKKRIKAQQVVVNNYTVDTNADKIFKLYHGILMESR